MSYRSCWKRLGIAHTADTAAIRRAYAAKLKRIDLDRDAEAFQALRDARDEAMHLATQPPGASDPDDDVDEEDGEVGDDGILWGLGDIAAELDTDPQPIVAYSEPITDGTIEDRDAPYHALYDLLDPDTPDRERWFPAGDEEAAIRAAFDAILADPRMEQIGYYDHQERWLATIIALSWPTSEPLVEPAVAQFGWAARAGEIGQDPAMDFAVQRAAAAQFERAVRSPNHADHRAWRELTKPADENSRRGWTVRSKSVNALLRKIRTDYPTLEGYLDPWRVSLWEAPPDPPPNKRQLAITVGAIILLNILIRLPGCDRASVTPPVPVVETLADVFAATSFRTTASIIDIRDTNPKFWGRLTSRLNAAKAARQPPEALVATIDTALADHVRQVMADPPYPVLRASAQFIVARANAIKATDWDGCAAVLFGSDRPQPKRPVPEAAKPALIEVRRQALLAETADAATSNAGSTKLDRDVADMIRVRSGLAGTTFSDALMNRGSAKNRCDTRIAAIQVALELPQERGEPLLRILAN